MRVKLMLEEYHFLHILPLESDCPGASEYEIPSDLVADYLRSMTETQLLEKRLWAFTSGKAEDQRAGVLPPRPPA